MTSFTSRLGRCGPYELLRWVESGGMGEIFLARGPTPDGRQEALVAVKRLLPQAAADPTFVTMFLDEARLAKHLRHPNICRVFDMGREGPSYYLAMQWIDGVSLQLLCRRAAGRGGVPVGVVGYTVMQIADALDYAHRLTDENGLHLGIVHRDVSPPNIMIGLDGSVHLLDFGVAKARTQLAKTQPGYVKGKFGYLAPEQLSGKVDYRTDVFALGLCLYEGLTGQQLFDQETATDTVGAIRAYEKPPEIRSLRPDVPQALEQVAQRALEPDPRQRFQSAGEMKLYIAQALEISGHRVGALDVADLILRLFPERRPATPPEVSESVPDAPPIRSSQIPPEPVPTEDLDAVRAERPKALILAVLLCAVLSAVGTAAFMLLR